MPLPLFLIKVKLFFIFFKKTRHILIVPTLMHLDVMGNRKKKYIEQKKNLSLQCNAHLGAVFVETLFYHCGFKEAGHNDLCQSTSVR